MHSQKPCIVGLAGGSGSGKTTLARIITTALPWPTTVVPLDQFYKDLSHLPLVQRRKVNFDEPDSLDMDLAFQTMERLSQGVSTYIPVYDFAVYNRSSEKQILHPSPVVVIEGMHTLYHAPLLELYDVSVFLDIDEPTRFQRKVERDIRERARTYESVVKMWEEFTKPMHDVYVQPTNIRATLRFTDSFAPQVIQVITNEIQRRTQMKMNVANVLPQ